MTLNRLPEKKVKITVFVRHVQLILNRSSHNDLCLYCISMTNYFSIASFHFSLKDQADNNGHRFQKRVLRHQQGFILVYSTWSVYRNPKEHSTGTLAKHTDRWYLSVSRIMGWWIIHAVCGNPIKYSGCDITYGHTVEELVVCLVSTNPKIMCYDNTNRGHVLDTCSSKDVNCRGWKIRNKMNNLFCWYQVNYWMGAR